MIGRNDCWVVKCQQCKYVTYQPEFASSVRAAKHMATRRHIVHRWRQDEPDKIIIHAPTNQDTLFELPIDPPF